ncbi:immunoglobulin superfamily member 1-like isoform X2 [Podarcis muralis]
MKFPSSILFLGCWLTRQWQISRGQLYRKPSISVRPSSQVILGEDFYIHCETEYNSEATFQLVKEGSSAAVDSKTASRYTDFPLSNAKHVEPNGGFYKCKYCFNENKCSEFSDNVYVNITGDLSPKPAIFVSPSPLVVPGTRFFIHCRNEYRRNEYREQATFYLFKEGTLGHLFSRTDSLSPAFLIPNAKQTDGGIYWCSYCFIQDQVQKCSGSSDRVYVNITDLDFNQRCSSYSDRVYINITDPWLSKPSITLTPTQQISTGMNVSIECQGAKSYVTFSLFKSNNLIASQEAEGNRNATKFFFSEVKLEDGGSYTCRYYRTGDSFLWSESSDPMELVVTDRFAVILWASIAAGLSLLILFLLVLAFILYRKGRKGSTAHERSQPPNISLESDSREDPDGVSYAALNHGALKSTQVPDADRIPESCTYAALAQGRPK